MYKIELNHIFMVIWLCTVGNNGFLISSKEVTKSINLMLEKDIIIDMGKFFFIRKNFEIYFILFVFSSFLKYIFIIYYF